MKVLRQLAKEFWLPLVVGLLWTAYNVVEQPHKQSFIGIVNAFGPMFFFASWLVAQWYRVRKQQKVEAGLEGIEQHVRSMLTNLESKTNDLISHITGGDSVCYLIGSPISPTQLGNFICVHHGSHPLYNVHMRIVDLEAFNNIKPELTVEKLKSAETHHHVGDLIPGHCATVPITTSLGTGNERRFNIFFTARNGSFTQLLRFKKANDLWTFATKVEKNGIRFEDVRSEFPKNSTGAVDWD